MYDVIIIGLGGMGSAAAAHLSARGRRVLGFEQFTRVHDRGSSHGESRIIRLAYFEDPAYVPLLLRAYELWSELEKQSGQQLYLRTGGLMVGRTDSQLVQGSLHSAREHGLKHEVLDAKELRRRFPATRPRDDEVALFELPAGVLFPEACVAAHLRRAVALGAELRFEIEAASWRSTPGGVEVTTTADECFEAQHLILCAGAWLEHLTADLRLPLRVERNVMHWFEPSEQPEIFTPEHLPVYIVEREGRPMLYGFPNITGRGIKAAFHHSGVYTTAQTLDRSVAGPEVEQVREALAEWLPDGAGRHVASVVCMYTLTPDEHFLIDRHPSSPSVYIAGGFSGHGFKFCGVVGEVLADLIVDGSTRHPVGLFSLDRFSSASRAPRAVE